MGEPLPGGSSRTLSAPPVAASGNVPLIVIVAPGATGLGATFVILMVGVGGAFLKRGGIRDPAGPPCPGGASWTQTDPASVVVRKNGGVPVPSAVPIRAV